MSHPFNDLLYKMNLRKSMQERLAALNETMSWEQIALAIYNICEDGKFRQFVMRDQARKNHLLIEGIEIVGHGGEDYMEYSDEVAGLKYSDELDEFDKDKLGEIFGEPTARSHEPQGWLWWGKIDGRLFSVVFVSDDEPVYVRTQDQKTYRDLIDYLELEASYTHERKVNEGDDYEVMIFNEDEAYEHSDELDQLEYHGPVTKDITQDILVEVFGGPRKWEHGTGDYEWFGTIDGELFLIYGDSNGFTIQAKDQVSSIMVLDYIRNTTSKETGYPTHEEEKEFQKDRGRRKESDDLEAQWGQPSPSWIPNESKVNEGLADHAKKELKLAGLFDKSGDYKGMIGEAVMQLIELFASQGHSGCSADITKVVFDRLTSFKPLTELTDNPDEWNEIAHEMVSETDLPLFQSTRSPNCFSRDGGKTYWNIDEIEGCRVPGTEPMHTSVERKENKVTEKMTVTTIPIKNDAPGGSDIPSKTYNVVGVVEFKGHKYYVTDVVLDDGKKKGPLVIVDTIVQSIDGSIGVNK